MPVDNPIGQNFPRAPGRLYTDRVESSRDKEIANFRRLTEQVAVVGREAFGTVEEELDPRFAQRRNAVDRCFKQRLDVLEIFRQLIE
jgi:hypothetical protein